MFGHKLNIEAALLNTRSMADLVATFIGNPIRKFYQIYFVLSEKNVFEFVCYHSQGLDVFVAITMRFSSKYKLQGRVDHLENV